MGLERILIMSIDVVLAVEYLFLDLIDITQEMVFIRQFHPGLVSKNLHTLPGLSGTPPETKVFGNENFLLQSIAFELVALVIQAPTTLSRDVGILEYLLLFDWYENAPVEDIYDFIFVFVVRDLEFISF